MKSFFKKIQNDELFSFNNSYFPLLCFALIVATYQIIIYFITGGNPIFTANDSFIYYLNEAQNIYRQKSLDDISKIMINYHVQYLNELFYGFKEPPKPCHFPIYSIYLSLFFYISNNYFFIAVLSQFPLALGLLQFNFLILKNFYNKSISLIICLIFFVVSPFAIYVADVSYELWSGCFILMIFYFGLFAKNRDDWKYYLSMFIAINLIVLRAKYFILIPIMILIYRLLPVKFSEEKDRISNKNLLLYVIFFLTVPLAIHYYCYQILGWHKFSDKLIFYKGIGDFLFNIFKKTVVNNYNIFFYKYYLYQSKLSLIIIYASLLFVLNHIIGILKDRLLKKFDVILAFIYILYFTNSFFYVVDGFRMLFPMIIYICVMIYKNHNFLSKHLFFNYKKPFLILVVLIFSNFFIRNFLMMDYINKSYIKMAQKNTKISLILNDYNINKVLSSFEYFNNYLVPIMILYRDKYFFIYNSLKNYCLDYEKTPDNVELMPIIFSNELDSLTKKGECLNILEKYEKFKKYDIEFYLKK